MIKNNHSIICLCETHKSNSGSGSGTQNSDYKLTSTGSAFMMIIIDSNMEWSPFILGYPIWVSFFVIDANGLNFPPHTAWTVHCVYRTMCDTNWSAHCDSISNNWIWFHIVEKMESQSIRVFSTVAAQTHLNSVDREHARTRKSANTPHSNMTCNRWVKNFQTVWKLKLAYFVVVTIQFTDNNLTKRKNVFASKMNDEQRKWRRQK